MVFVKIFRMVSIAIKMFIIILHGYMTFIEILMVLIIIILQILVHLGDLLACLRLFFLLLKISLNQILLTLFPISQLLNAKNLLPTPYSPRKNFALGLSFKSKESSLLSSAEQNY